MRTLIQRLAALYDQGEAKAIVRWVLDARFGLSMADVLCGRMAELSADDQGELERIMQRLEKGEPVQYVLGVADFCGRQFHVAPGVLIPRPETAELCLSIVESGRKKTGGDYHILDVGTGSGCIAITLALEMPEAKVTAWDISENALVIARDNAKTLGADVTFERRNALNCQLSNANGQFDIIVSNPPYICDWEKATMEKNVLGYEPHIALFVPDDDPLRFYCAIARYAIKALKPQGRLFLELNPLYAKDTEKLLQETGFTDTEIRQDQSGKQRFLKAINI